MGIYKTAVHGIPVDMDKLRAQNEKEVALGNMGTNARGDVLGKGGEILKTREEVIEKFYEANPNLNAKAVGNFKSSPLDKKVVVDERTREVKEASTVPQQAQQSTSRKKKENKIAETFNVEE